MKISKLKIQKLCGWYSQDKILQNTITCQDHNLQYTYLCLNNENNCKQHPLMCPGCLQTHRNHHFQSITNYFTLQFRDALKYGTSANGHAISRLYEHVISDITKMRTKLNSQIDKLQKTAKYQIDQLKKKYPLAGQFNIPGTQINTQNITTLMDIFNKQNKRNWVPATQKYIRSLLGQATIMITNLLYDLQQYISDQNWESFDQDHAELKVKQFLEKYSEQFNPDQHFFKFSTLDKHYNIRVNDAGLGCQYLDTNPSNPAILTQNSFTRNHDTIYFMVSKMQKTLKIFDATLIVLGACNPVAAKTFGFRDLIDQAHGAYMIGSNGKSYHSNSTKYNKKTLAFDFGQSDVIAVKIDYNNKMINFSKYGFYQRKFKMELQCKDDDLLKLKPCVLFHGEKGALVTIVDQNAYFHKDKQQDVV